MFIYVVAQVAEYLELVWLEPIMIKPLAAAKLLPVTYNHEISPTLINIEKVSLKENVTFRTHFGTRTVTHMFEVKMLKL